MRYYVVADVHGFYNELKTALNKVGYFEDKELHKLIVCGDLFDRGKQAKEVEEFICDLISKDEVILIRGNHEDLFIDMIEKDYGMPCRHHLSNGTYDTALQLTGYNKKTAYEERKKFVAKAKNTLFYKRIIPSIINYFETDKYIFVHGWIPFNREYPFRDNDCAYKDNWRNATDEEWYMSRWINGMEASKSVIEKDKTIVCGHWHTSYGHSIIENKCSEFGDDADFTPYVNDGIIALDACTVHSGFVNCVVIED